MVATCMARNHQCITTTVRAAFELSGGHSTLYFGYLLRYIAVFNVIHGVHYI